MIGVVGVLAFLTVLAMSLAITRLATTALILTGLSEEAARFQARIVSRSGSNSSMIGSRTSRSRNIAAERRNKRRRRQAIESLPGLMRYR